MSFIIGIRRQDKSVWQRRTPIAPCSIQQIILTNKDINFIVQPSKKRIFSDQQYKKISNVIISEDLTLCNLIIGVKQIPIQNFIPNKTYMYFSHTIKAQSHNMNTLDFILKNNIRLIDYQKITDQNNNRLIAFGRYAGIAGTLDFLKGLGQFIMQMGINTPLLSANCAYKYFDLKQAYAHIQAIGRAIKQKSIPKQLRPFILAITGRGRTAKGCYEVLQNLPITHVKPKELQNLCADINNPQHAQTIYIVNINTEDTIIPRDPQTSFDKKDYYLNPSKYKSIFHKQYLPYISGLLHCIFWDIGCPKYIKNKHLKELASNDKLRLMGICDVSCDLDGSIQCLQDYTQPQAPFFYFDSLTGLSNRDSKYSYGKLLYLAVDFLPCELAYDASMHFSQLLKKWIPNIVRSNPNVSVENQMLLPEIQRAVITNNGSLTASFQYIDKLREQNKSMNTLGKNKDEKKTQVGATTSIQHSNITIIPQSKIQPQKLDFDKI